MRTPRAPSACTSTTYSSAPRPGSCSTSSTARASKCCEDRRALCTAATRPAARSSSPRASRPTSCRRTSRCSTVATTKCASRAASADRSSTTSSRSACRGLYDARDGWLHNRVTGHDLNDVDLWAARAIIDFTPTDSLLLRLTVHGGENSGGARQFQHRGQRRDEQRVVRRARLCRHRPQPQRRRLQHRGHGKGEGVRGIAARRTHAGRRHAHIHHRLRKGRPQHTGGHRRQPERRADRCVYRQAGAVERGAAGSSRTATATSAGSRVHSTSTTSSKPTARMTCCGSCARSSSPMKTPQASPRKPASDCCATPTRRRPAAPHCSGRSITSSSMR